MSKKSEEDRFWAKVDKKPGFGPSGDCWGWRGAVDGAKQACYVSSQGYQASRYSFWLHTGEAVPKGVRLWRTCKNGTCTKPEHLYLEPSEEEKFWGYVDKSTKNGPNGTCWVWTAGTSPDGYGKFSAKGKTVRAHRYALALVKGPLADDLCVLHSCHNIKCVNPDHLSEGTQLDNKWDAMVADRTYRKLTAEQVLEIRRLRSAGVMCSEIASRFGISTSHVSSLAKGYRWFHLPLTGG